MKKGISPNKVNLTIPIKMASKIIMTNALSDS
jgi:hypothetical protein